MIKLNFDFTVFVANVWISPCLRISFHFGITCIIQDFIIKISPPSSIRSFIISSISSDTGFRFLLHIKTKKINKKSWSIVWNIKKKSAQIKEERNHKNLLAQNVFSYFIELYVRILNFRSNPLEISPSFNANFVMDFTYVVNTW